MADTMTVLVNGAEQRVPTAATLATVVASAAGERRRGVAVAVNAGVVPRSEWDTTVLTAGDSVEILEVHQGG